MPVLLLGNSKKYTYICTVLIEFMIEHRFILNLVHTGISSVQLFFTIYSC